MTRYRAITVMSHTSGEITFGVMIIWKMRWMLPRSTRMKPAARQMLTVETTTAGSATFLKRSMLNTCAELATIRPPADRPTKNMNRMMFAPQ